LAPVERGVLQGLAAFRWGAWLWMAAVLLVSRRDLARPWLALALVIAATVVTATHTVLLRSAPEALLRPAPVVAELAVGAALVLCDGWAYGRGHAFSVSQALGSVWPLAGVLTAGVALGPLAGGAAGATLGAARVGATLANGATASSGGRVLSLVNTTVFYGLAGAVSGYVAALLRRAEREISAARAREEVARTLHDGVLQTLAVVERRTSDPALARLAREQERELREYLFGVAEREREGDGATRRGLAPALRSVAARSEDAFGTHVRVLVADDVPDIDEDLVFAVAGAVGEALTNAGKHGGASSATVYVEPYEGGRIFCSIKDDGCGFDPATTVEGVGLGRSIRGRVVEAGGRVQVRSQPGAGTEVCLWL
jgi:signal transduction histidine kinase